LKVVIGKTAERDGFVFTDVRPAAVPGRGLAFDGKGQVGAELVSEARLHAGVGGAAEAAGQARRVMAFRTKSVIDVA
jgi:hypothetical protein